MSFLDPKAFSSVAAVTERHARRILANAMNGTAWRGKQLIVEALRGETAQSGRKYLVALSSLPDDLQKRAKDLDLPLQEPFDRQSQGEIADWQREDAKFRLRVITVVSRKWWKFSGGVVRAG